MTAAGWIEIALYVAILTALTPCSAATWRASTAASSGVGPVERRRTRSRRREQDWKAYAQSVLVFSAVFLALLYLILRTQGSTHGTRGLARP